MTFDGLVTFELRFHCFIDVPTREVATSCLYVTRFLRVDTRWSIGRDNVEREVDFDSLLILNVCVLLKNFR